MGYWEDRLAKSQNKLTSKNVKATEAQLKKYYKKAMEDVVGQFEKTYQHLLSSIEKGKEPTPADLYNLDKYWQMQAQLKTELQKLGDKSYKLMSQDFENQYKTIYDSLSLPSGQVFNSLSNETAQQMINQIWCADGKSWSQRIWTNTDKLQQALNDNLINCVLTGKKPTELKQMLMQDFNVSFNNADTIVRTEMAHIQTQAAKQRYEDYGITEVEILADKDERQCEVCGKLHKKRYPTSANVPIPAHPRCRCSVIPVVEMAKTPLKIDIQLFAKSSENYEKHNKPLTKKQEATIIKLDEAQQEAQKVVDSIQNEEMLEIGNQGGSHQKHAYEELGLSRDVSPKEAYEKYRVFCTEFLKEPIDGIVVDGFIGVDEGQLVKYNKHTKLYGTLRADGKIGSVYTAYDEYWEERKILLHPNTDEATRQALIKKLRKQRRK